MVVVTGEAGTGKTLLVQRAMPALGADVIPVLHGDPQSSFDDFLDSACKHLRPADAYWGESIPPEDRFQLFWDYLLVQHARGRSLVVFVDDAQNISEALLDRLALVSRWTRSGKQVLQLVLVGLPSLEALVQKLVRRELIGEHYPIHRLAPLTPDLVAQVAQPAPIDAGARNAAEPETVGHLQSVLQERPRLMTVSCSRTNQEGSQMSRVENLNKILKNLQSESPGIESSALISEDGLMIASALSTELDDTRVGGMTATLLNLGTRASTELRRGEVKEVIVRGDDGYAVMVSAGRGALLLVLTNENTKLGLILFDMREAVKSINKVL